MATLHVRDLARESQRRTLQRNTEALERMAATLSASLTPALHRGLLGLGFAPPRLLRIPGET